MRTVIEIETDVKYYGAKVTVGIIDDDGKIWELPNWTFFDSEDAAINGLPNVVNLMKKVISCKRSATT